MTMPDTLYLRFPTDDPAVECRWLCVDASGAVRGMPGAGGLDEAASHAAQARTVWVLPGDRVALTRATLPSRAGKRAAALAPFALEDQLAAEIETLHFAVGPQADDGSLDVAITDRDRLTDDLATLAAHGLVPQAAHGALQLLPATPQTQVMLVDGGQILVRQSDGDAYCADLIDGRSSRECLPPVEPDTPCVLYTTAASYYGREGVHSPDDALPAGARAVGAPQFLEHGPLQLYADLARHAEPINLLQGPFAQATDMAAGWARWRSAVAVLLACLAVNLVASGVDLYRSHRAEAALDKELHAAYGEAMPGVDIGRLPAPRLAVEARVRRASTAGRSALIATLDALGTAVTAAPGSQVKSVNFHDGAVEVVLTAADLAALNQIQQAIGPSARLAGVSTPDPQHAEGRLNIAGATP